VTKWQEILIPGLLAALGFMAWWGIERDQKAMYAIVIEAKELASHALATSHEAKLNAATARPDPFTGTDGDKLRQFCLAQDTNTIELLTARFQRDIGVLDRTLTGMEKEHARFVEWHKAHQAFEDICREDRSDLRNRIIRLEHDAQELRKFIRYPHVSEEAVKRRTENATTD